MGVNRALLFLLLVLLNVNGLRAADATSVATYLSSISVTVENSRGETGTGVAITRKDSTGKDVTFIWTAGHVCQEIIDAKTFLIAPEEGDKPERIRMPARTNYFTNVLISQEVTINGKHAYTTNIPATVIKCSPNITGNDLAILRVTGKFFNTNSVAFDLSGRIPKLGESLYGLGSPYGDWGTFSVGVFSYIGRDFDDWVFDQTSLVVYPGSSGGGVYTTDGKCVGLSMIMKLPSVNYICPVRRMQEWAKAEGVEWALDPSIPMPSEKELKSLQRSDRVLRVIKPKPEGKSDPKKPSK